MSTNGQTLQDWADVPSAAVMFSISQPKKLSFTREALAKRFDRFLLLKICSKTGQTVGQWSDQELNTMIEINGIDRTRIALIHANVLHVALHWLYVDGIALDKLMDTDPKGYYVYALTQLISFQNATSLKQLMLIKEAVAMRATLDYTNAEILLKFVKAKFLLFRKLSNLPIEDVKNANKVLHKYLTLSRRLHKTAGNNECIKRMSLHPIVEKWAFDKRFDELTPEVLIPELKIALQKLVNFFAMSAKLREQVIENLENYTQIGASNFINQYKRSKFVDVGIIVENLIPDYDPYNNTDLLDAEIKARRMMHKLELRKVSNPTNSSNLSSANSANSANSSSSNSNSISATVNKSITGKSKYIQPRDAVTGIRLPTHKPMLAKNPTTKE